jgi:hypothetical protein
LSLILQSFIYRLDGLLELNKVAGPLATDRPSDSISLRASAASKVTVATPTAQSVSEAKPTISAILATKIEKLIPTERIPSSRRR